MITVKVLFFATIRSAIGLRDLELEIPENSSVKDLKVILSNLYPQAGPTMEFMLAAVNRVFSDELTVLQDQAEIAFFPRISGR